jgi:uncharacterized protein
MLFNSLLFLLDGFALWIMRRYRKVWVTVAMGATVAAAGIVWGIILVWLSNDRKFLFVRFAAYGIFLHGPLLMSCAACLWWKQRKIFSLCLAFAAASILSVAGYAFLIEPYWLDIAHYEISSPKIHRTIRIVVLADPQMDQLGDYEKRAFAEALRQKPDFLLLAGDYAQIPEAKYHGLLWEVNAYLREIGFSAPRGAFAVQGNVDGYHWQDMFADLDIAALESRQHFEFDDLQLTCLGLGESFNPQTQVENPDPRKFHLVMGHVPNYALGKIDAELLLAGHTHGGQVRLPFVGAMITQAGVPRAWAAGLTDLPEGGKLLVSRGIGMERWNAPRIRFLCRPELVVIDLVPEKPGEKDE